MGLLRWVGAVFSGMGDRAGVQYTKPITGPIHSARTLSPDAAVQTAAVWACVDLLSRTMASLPCDVYTVEPDGTRHPDLACNLHYLLTVSPNAVMTPFEFWQTLTMHWALRGNAYALIKRNPDGTARSLTPLNSDQMVVDTTDGKLLYYYTNQYNKPVKYKPADIMHWKCMGNGIVGLSKLEYMRASVYEGVTAQDNAIDMYAGKGRIQGILTSQAQLNTKQQQEIARQFALMKTQGGIPVLPAQLAFQQLSLTPADTQLLQTRQFNLDEICRWFGVPSALINGAGGAAGSNIEQVTANFYKSTILPMCISAEQALMKRVACISERRTHEVRFRLSFLNKAADKDRYAMNAQAVQNGWKTRNEVRLDEGLPPLQDVNADALTVQNNLTTIEKLGENDPSQTPQTPLTQEPIQQ